jgi:DNA modification methylase
MAGTGSFGIAAILNGRNALIVEQASEFTQLDTIRKRIEEIVEEIAGGNDTFEFLREVIGD